MSNWTLPWAGRRPWWALLLWVLLLVGASAAAATVGTAYHDDHALPGTESGRVAEVLGDGAQGNDTITVVFATEAGVAADPRVAAALADLAAAPAVAEVAAPSIDSHSVSADGRIGYATLTLDTAPDRTDVADVRAIQAAAQEHRDAGLRIEFGGESVRAANESGGAAEGIGMAAALVILLVLFGSLLAALLPIVSAIFAVGASIALVGLLSGLVDIPSYAPPMMALVGIGVGIDYALLIFARYRAELIAGRTRAEAAAVAERTAGRAVILAGTTVIVALLGLTVMGLGALRGLALSVVITVLLTMAASRLLLPALLTIFGPRVERAVGRRAERRASRAGAAPGARWRRLSDRVGRRPWIALAGGLALLAVLTAPAADLRLGFADAGTDPVGSTSRAAYDLLAEGFGAGSNGPLVILAEGADAAQLAGAAERLGAVAGVAEVAGPLPGEHATLLVFPSEGPAAQATIDLVHELRDRALPALAGEIGGTYAVGGATAAAIDFAELTAQRMPWFAAVVLGLSTLLLLLVFRSVLIPVKAAVLNVLSIGAALGAMTWVYGEGNLGVPAGPVEAFLPVIVFAVVFGLSMDYEVFLVARMHEEWQRTGDPRLAVREGLAGTGSVITAAAAIMVVVFGAFMLSPDRMLGQMGLGLAVAILVDAVIVRCLIVPAVMLLAGRHAWWLPRWLDVVLPRVRLEPRELLDDARGGAEHAAAAPSGRARRERASAR